MRLLILTQKVDMNDSNLGFFHRWLLEFAKHFDLVTVICLEEGAHELPSNVKVLSLGKEEKKSRVTYISRFYTYIWRERANYDAVFIHMNPEYVVLGGLFWRLWRKKVSLWYTHKSVNIKLRVATLLAHRIFTASKESFRIKSGKVVVTGHGIDTEYWKPMEVRPPHDLNLITVGRIGPAKQIEVILRAVEAAPPAAPANLTVVGGPIQTEDNSYLEMLKRRVSELNLTDKVRFVGPKKQSEVLGYLQRSDIFLHASSTGSLDKAALEAMSSGVVVISCNDALLPILQSFGLTFKPGDAADLGRVSIQVKNAGSLNALGLKLREIVVKNHSLTSLISRIAQSLAE